MKPFFALVVLILSLQEIPLKDKEEFNIKLDFQFKTRTSDANTVSIDGPPRNSGSVLPFLSVNVDVLNIRGDENKVKVIDNTQRVLLTRTLAKSASFQFPLGFTDDLKDHVSAHTFDIIFLSKERQPVRRITISVEKDGTYLVNGEKRGKL
jgi:hypothetical protein